MVSFISHRRPRDRERPAPGHGLVRGAAGIEHGVLGSTGWDQVLVLFNFLGVFVRGAFGCK